MLIFVSMNAQNLHHGFGWVALFDALDIWIVGELMNQFYRFFHYVFDIISIYFHSFLTKS